MRYKPRKSKRNSIHIHTKAPPSVFNPSNSVEHQEIVLITNGFKPEFNQDLLRDREEFAQQAPRTMKTMRKSKNKKRGKRILKRV